MRKVLFAALLLFVIAGSAQAAGYIQDPNCIPSTSPLFKQYLNVANPDLTAQICGKGGTSSTLAGSNGADILKRLYDLENKVDQLQAQNNVLQQQLAAGQPAQSITYQPAANTGGNLVLESRVATLESQYKSLSDKLERTAGDLFWLGQQFVKVARVLKITF